MQADLQVIPDFSLESSLERESEAVRSVQGDPYLLQMATITSSVLGNGLPLHRIAMEGTRAVTLLVAFDAGARTERPEENGMAHFLEHLVFKGGEKYKTYRDVNEAAERNGASSTPTPATTSSRSTSPRARPGAWRPPICSPISSAERRSTLQSSTRSAGSWSRRSRATTTSRLRSQ